ncbi:MAG: enoyl-CoA hydratase/isomerase family protein [Rhodospirillaceae bacterium]|jgi:enoyl-CoA hydratase|nr:enoyl-CoA hydratase/isomerase family protein [Rhodospirillaceae bacterium]MBT5039628.1 enoyl-CoA hydratase/isomerase family protein [Rhodospirillaceae bacterium]MBT5674617.1 enoyl-CoA hydratase/isomerase family protein [Rhodospirillaceae bacterium]MBT5781158.1 enoyl-CoA hydratase/isomerase family protein [Rhodospirillaceae bacterium]MBT6828679.1 enoyl-CoA hydratase/isomerase family protein [Rhodospirillaceae bacterium]
MPNNLQIERLGASVLVLLDRPDVRNAVNYELIDEFEETLDALNRDTDCRSIIISGSGERAFCAGMDLNVARGLDADSSADWLVRLKRLYEAVRGLDKPSVAALNGVAAGAGYQLALLADLRVGHKAARMGQPEINVGLASVLGAHIMAPFLGHARTVELTLSGRLMDGDECFRLGLFNHLVDAAEVHAKAIAVAEELAQKPPTAMRLTKQRFREDGQAAFDATFEIATRLQREAYTSGEPQRVMAEYFAKKG